jgi:hypothetical protein
MGTGPEVALKDYDYSLQGGGYGALNDPEWIGARFVKTLDDLSEVNSIYSNWLLTDTVKLKQVKLSDVRDDITALVKNNVERNDADEPDPVWGGYYMCAFNAPVGGPRTVSFSVFAAAKTIQHFQLKYGRDGSVDPALVSTSLFKASLEPILANWPCDWATATGFKSELSYTPTGPYIRVGTSSFHRPTWLAYLAAGRTSNLTPPAGLTAERTNNGGLLMISAPDGPDPSDPAQVERADRLTAFMKGRNDPPR